MKTSTIETKCLGRHFCTHKPKLTNEPTVETFFEGSHAVYEGAQESYSSQSIIIREKQGSTAATQKGAFVASAWKIQNGTETARTSTPADLATNLTFTWFAKSS